jgi:hypothetical protein
MIKILRETRDDGFLNIYDEGLFVRCYEHSALKLAEITWYQLMLNLDRKTWFVSLTAWFPTEKLGSILKLIATGKQDVRVINQNWEEKETISWVKLDRNAEVLVEKKKKLLKF